MRQLKCINFLFFNLILPVVVCGNYTYTDHANVLSNILSGYDTDSRPMETTSIIVGMELFRITGLDIVAQTIGMAGYLFIFWSDARLFWSTDLYNGLNKVHTNPSKIWTPPLVLSNTAGDIKTIRGDEYIPVAIIDSGFVIWDVPVNMVAACDVDITYFPFDKQTCNFKLSSWLYDDTEVVFQLIQKTVMLGDFEVHGEWELLSTNISTDTAKYNRQNWSVIKITMELKRKYTYYLINMVLPVFVLNVLGILVFTLPPESGEKIGFSLTILLALSVVLTIIADSIPTTSLNVCILSLYLFVGFALCSVEVVMTVVVLKSFTYESQEKPVSPRVQWFARVVMAKLSLHKVCSNRGASTDAKTDEELPIDDEIETKKKPIASNQVMCIREAHELSRMSAVEADCKQTEVVEKYSWTDISTMLDTICLYFFSFGTFLYSLVFLLILFLA